MVYALAGLSLIALLVIMIERKVYRVIIYTGVFSLMMAGIYLMLGSPDVAMAEAAIATYATIFFIVVAERYYKKYRKRGEDDTTSATAYEKPKKGPSVARVLLALAFTAGLGFLFVSFIPDINVNLDLRTLYLENFKVDVGGQNPIAAILMGYRLYDTLFEALLLVIAIMAVSHLSFYDGVYVKEEKGDQSHVKRDKIAFYSIRIISPIIILFGIYLVANGHLSAGGGFQGGLAIAAFFVCRYMIHNIYDLPVKKVLKLEEIVFMALAIVAVIMVFVDTASRVSDEYRFIFQSVHLYAANFLVGIKVACGFFILFYRFVAVERLKE